MDIISWIEQEVDLEVRELVKITIPNIPPLKISSSPKEGGTTYHTKESHCLSPKAEYALEALMDHFYNRESPARIVERKPDLDYYDNRRTINTNNNTNSNRNNMRELILLRGKGNRKKHDYAVFPCKEDITPLQKKRISLERFTPKWEKNPS